jgi:hypothetical protein
MTTAAQSSYASPRVLPRPSLRPLALPSEHGGWGFLFEPLVLALVVAPSWAGLLLSVAFICGFLTRQPLKLALQDALRRKSYPRTSWCWRFVTAYGLGATAALVAAIYVSGWTILIPIGIAAPFGLVQIAYDAKNRSRALLPELGGAAAIASSAAAIALADGWALLPALALSAIIIARIIPTIVYVRTLLKRAHKQQASSTVPVVLHIAAVGVALLISSKLAVAMMTALLLRALWGLTHPVPPARRVGWTEISWGAATVLLIALGQLLSF